MPHEVSMRNTTEVMNLIEKEGMEGYGIYWAIMEYLRTQDDYTGDVRVLRTLARQLKTKLCKVESVLHNYGLFTLTDFTFRSIKLDAMMRPLENKRKAMEKQNESKPKAERNQDDCKTLKTNDSVVLSKVKESKGKESKEKESITSSSKEEDKGDDGGDVFIPETPAWERHVMRFAV